MNTNICNVIWVDDDIENICPKHGMEGLNRTLRKFNIRVIGRARTLNEFTETMDLYKDRVDAVITDANFSKDKPSVAHPDDFTGLIGLTQVIQKHNEKRSIPFYLYSGKEEYFPFKNGELDYFGNDRRFRKGDYEKLFEQLRQDVEHIKSPEFRIRNKYAAELEAAALIPSNEDRLLNALLYAYSEDWKNTEDYFNPMRKIVEAIFIESKNLNIIPPIDKLNAIRTFLGKCEYENYCVIEGEEIMPKTLARSLRYFLDIVQDASHELEEDRNKLRVDDYVRNVKNINIFKSVLHIAMDLCLWFKRIKDEIDSDTYKCKWYVKTSDPVEDKEPPKPKRELSDSIRNMYEKKCHELQLDEEGFWHCKECYISITQWEEGDIVELSELSLNTNAKTKYKYPYYAKYKRVNNKKSD